MDQLQQSNQKEQHTHMIQYNNVYTTVQTIQTKNYAITQAA